MKGGQACLSSVGLVIGLIVLLLCAAPAPAQMFTDVAPALGMNQEGSCADVIWYDWDGDGDQDLMMVRRFSAGNSYWRNDGDHFTLLNDTGLPEFTDGGMPSPVDIDHDGDLDYWMRCYHTPGLLMVTENGVWVDRTDEFGLPSTTGWRDFDWADVDHDGWMDLILGHYQTGFHLYRNIEGTHFEETSDSLGLPHFSSFAEMCEADVNDDGNIELFITQLSGQDYYFINDGNGHFRDATAEAGFSDAHGFADCRWADFDRDKFPDLLIQNSTGHEIWHNNHDGTFTRMNMHGADCSDWGGGGEYPGGPFYAIADYNMDGLLDFYAGIPGGGGSETAPNQLMMMDSVQGLDIWFHNEAAAQGVDFMPSSNPSVVDFDGDGAMDICMAGTNDPMRLLHNNCTRRANHLEIQPLGPNGERDKWHTRVEVYPHGGTTAIAASELTTSNAGRNGLNAYFVLDQEGHYDVKLRFADGAVMNPGDYPQLCDVVPSQVNHMLTVFEGQQANSTPNTPNPSDFRLDALYPNPFNASTTVHYSVPMAGHTRIAVYDVLGRHVTDLVNESVGPGEHRVIWNASNVATGVYFVRLQSDGKTAQQKALLLK